jgi:hypothetical protein
LNGPATIRNLKTQHGISSNQRAFVERQNRSPFNS